MDGHLKRMVHGTRFIVEQPKQEALADYIDSLILTLMRDQDEEYVKQAKKAYSPAKDYNLIEGEVIPIEKWQYIWHSSLSQPDIHVPARANPDAIRYLFLEARSLMPRKTFLSLLTLAALSRVTRAAKDAKHKRFKQVKSFFLGHASVPGVGQTIRKIVMTKEEKQFAEEAEKAAAAFHGHGRGG
ncbi:hypothetical protein Bbelb_036060 [Branchiostoma belcheri]|nr:hypothetical protein Bbelb_036060 [Branchiostoma belcheri]